MRPIMTIRMEITAENTGRSIKKLTFIGQTILDGFAELESESGGLVKLEKFEGVVIPPHFKHRVARTSPRCLWLTVFAAEMFALQQ